jgi:hypothetical protein
VVARPGGMLLQRRHIQDGERAKRAAVRRYGKS